MRLSLIKNRYVIACSFRERFRVEDAGFQWDDTHKHWFTESPYVAYRVHTCADNKAARVLNMIKANIQLSSALSPVIGYDSDYYPFQAAGIEIGIEQLRKGRKSVLLADEQGGGKTIEAIGIANELNLKKLMVICPASLRLNWAREIEKWHRHSLGVNPVVSAKNKVDLRVSNVVSYNLAAQMEEFEPDLIIVDEVHALKNAEAQRTKLVLGRKGESPGLVNKAPVLLLSGTPTPNGRPSELWSCIYRLAPDVINGMTYWTFVRNFCTWEDNGLDIKITGAKNTKELNTRLRGSGWMIRRYKKDVLKDLPPKQYKMVVFPVTRSTQKVVKKESGFSAEEIIAHGVPVGSGLPALRREMGVAKTPDCLTYINSFLEGGEEKVVIFAHHKEVIEILVRKLDRWGVVVIVGATPQKKRQAAVDSFQSDPRIRVFIGSEAAEEGWTLTAAYNLIMVEPEWVPGKNDQRADRLHRIGQKFGVLVHLLVVERSLDARILSSAADKATDIENILGIGE